MKTIGISETNLAFLKRLKREKRQRSLDDVIGLLIQFYQQMQSLPEKPKDVQSLQNTSKEAQSLPDNPLQFVEDNPCPYRTIIKDKSGFIVLCAETKKIPLEACITRQKRYIQFNKKCIPIGFKPKPKSKPQTQKTRIFRDEFERAYYPDSENYYRDDWGDTF